MAVEKIVKNTRTIVSFDEADLIDLLNVPQILAIYKVGNRVEVVTASE